MSELAELLEEYETPFWELTEEEWKEYYSSTETENDNVPSF